MQYFNLPIKQFVIFTALLIGLIFPYDAYAANEGEETQDIEGNTVCPFEQLPTEIVILLMGQEGVAKAMQPVSKEFATHATDPTLKIQTILSSKEDLEKYAKHNNIKDWSWNLSRVKIAYTDFNDEDLEKLVEANPNLTYLDLSGCKEITDKGLEHIQEMLLTELSLCQCKKVTNDGLRVLPQTLTQLDLSQCEQITDPGLLFLQRLSYLTLLNLNGCSQITDAGVAILESQEGFYGLAILKETCCNNISSDDTNFLGLPEEMWDNILSLSNYNHHRPMRDLQATFQMFQGPVKLSTQTLGSF